MPRPSRKQEVLNLLPEADAVSWPKGKLGQRGTVAYLMKQTGIQTDSAVGRYLNMLYDEGLAYIGRWNRTRKAPAAVWVRGKGEHAERPEPLPRPVIRKRYVKNVAKAIEQGRAGRAYDKRYSRHVAAALASDTVARTSVAPVQWFSALGL